MSTTFKVLVNGRSWETGDHLWSLPERNNLGEWIPGAWNQFVRGPSYGPKGILLSSPARQWPRSWDGVLYVAEYEEVLPGTDGEGLVAARCRLLQPVPQEELPKHGIFEAGEHEVSRGFSIARGTARVHANGSAEVNLYGTAYCSAMGKSQVHAWERATVQAGGDCEVVAYDDARVEVWGNAVVRVSMNARVVAIGSAIVRASTTSDVVLRGDCTGFVYKADRLHVGERATCIIYAKPRVFTRDDSGVILYRNGSTVEVHSQGGGLDGWEYDEGTWKEK